MTNDDNDSSGPRQTQSYLREMLQMRGLEPKSKLGQNFLIDLNLIDLILRVSEPSPRDLAIEVGSGTGGLTTRLAQHCGAVLSIEIDPAFHNLASEVVVPREDVILLHADVLANKNHFNPDFLEVLQLLRKRHPDFKLKLIANLPYAVATPVIGNFLCSDIPIERMVVTVQWEIAERLTAEPGTKDFGALSVLAQSLANVQIIRRLSPAVFWPRPKVLSAIVRLFPKESKRKVVGDVQKFRNFLRDLYTHRRKNLRGALIGWPNGGPRDKQEVDRQLGELNIDGRCRAETLTIEQHLELSRVFGER